MNDNIDETLLENGFWEAIKKSVKYMVQSIQGKYNLDSYLRIMGDFTDEEILKMINEGCVYGGGEITFFTQKETTDIRATVEMKFYSEGEKKEKLKKAERMLEKKQFTDETVDFLEKNQILTFEIKEPGER